jgi:hypothetical protein
MKVYTEVVYAWDDNKGELVEESSKSFDYEGEISKCDSRKGGPRWARYNIPHSHWKPPKVKDVVPKIVLPKIVTDAASGINTTLSGAASTLQTNLEGAASGVSEGLSTGTSAARAGLHAAASAGKTNLAYGADAGKAFAHKGADLFKAGMQKLGLHKKDDPGSDTTVGSTSAPGQALTMGQGGQGGMESALMKTIRKTTAGAGGKRRLRKIKKRRIGATV